MIFIFSSSTFVVVFGMIFGTVLFGHAGDDDFIQPHHSDRIFDAYMGDKNIIKFEGDHTSPRPQFYFDSINIFFHNVLQPPEDAVKGNLFDTSLDYLGKDMHGVGYEYDFEVTPQVQKMPLLDSVPKDQ